MESFFSRYRNETVLVSVLFVQLIMLATQIKVQQPVGPGAGYDSTTQASGERSGTRLIRVWAAAMVTPFERLGVNTGEAIRGTWHEYVDLRRVRRDNEQLQQDLNRLRLEQVRDQQDIAQGRRLQSLLGFRESFPSKTVAAQVIGTSGSEMSRVIYIDKGSTDGLKAGMAVISPDGIVGKILRADRWSSQVLLIDDPSSGAGVILERARLNGILKGSSNGKPEVLNVMADESIERGDKIITSGGDRIFPKGLPVGEVESVRLDPDREPFLQIVVKPAVNLSRLEEVLVVTEMAEQQSTPETAVSTSRTIDMLAQRLPSAKKAEVPEGIKAVNKENTEVAPSIVKPEVKPDAIGASTTKSAPTTGTAATTDAKPKPAASSTDGTATSTSAAPGTTTSNTTPNKPNTKKPETKKPETKKSETKKPAQPTNGPQTNPPTETPR